MARHRPRARRAETVTELGGVANATRVAAAPRVLIYTASIGGGHKALARAIEDDMAGSGREILVLDGLAEIGWIAPLFCRSGYVFQLRFAPWSIQPTFDFKTHPRVAAVLRVVYGVFLGPWLLRSIHRHRPDLIVSTYPAVTLILSWLRQRGRLEARVVTVIADYGAHAMWVGPATDLHLVSSLPSRELVRRVGGRAAVARMPVSPEFHVSRDRMSERARLDLPADRFVVLVACGAWGVGDIEPAVAAAVAAGAFPVVVTGNNAALKTRLDRRYPRADAARILGWTPDMASLMAAADCLVQNAGGMTCHEAAAAGLPIVFFRPIPGHGRLNAEMMADAGAAEWVDSPTQLEQLLRDAIHGRRTLLAPTRTGTPVARVLGELADRGTDPRPSSRPERGPRRGIAIAMIMLALLLWLVMTPWTGGVNAMLLPPALGVKDMPQGTAMVIVRVTDPEVAHALEDEIVATGEPVALFVDTRAASGLYPHDGIVIGVAQDESTSYVAYPWREWHQSRSLAKAIRTLTGAQHLYVLSPSDGRTLLSYVFAPERGHQVGAHGTGTTTDSRGIVLVDVAHTTPAEAVARLDATISELQEEGLTCVPLPSLS